MLELHQLAWGNDDMYGEESTNDDLIIAYTRACRL